MNDLLSSLVEMVVSEKIDSIHAGLPAKIVKYDPKTQKATVQPLIKYKDRSSDTDPNGLKDMPVIQNIPVIHPSAGTAIVSFPVQVGDIVALMFCSRSIDNFIISNGVDPVDPQDYRVFHADDCYAVLGLYPFSKALGSHPSDLEVRMNSGKANECKVALKPNGDVVVTTPAKFIVNAESNVEINTSADALVNVSGNAEINVSGSTTLTSNGTTINSETTINGNTTVNGNVSINGNQNISGNSTASDHISGGKSGKSHTHGGVSSGGSQTAPPT